MGINLTSSGGTNAFNLESLSKMAESVGNNDKIRGKVTQKGESFTLYSSSKGEGLFKTGKRDLKQTLAKQFLETAFQNTLSSLPPSLREGRLSILLSNVIDNRNMKEFKGSDLKSIVNEAKQTIHQEVRRQMLELIGDKVPTKETFESINTDEQKKEQIKELLNALPKNISKGTGLDRLETLEFTWVTLQCELDGKLRRDCLPQAKNDLRRLVENELDKGKINPGTILRGNTASTKYSASFMKTIGGDYTVSVLKPILEDLAKAGSLELDPQKIEVAPKSLRKGETVDSKQKQIAEDNSRKLGEIYDKLMNNLASSVKSMPQEMRDTCALTYALIKRAGGDDQTARNGASATIILRLLSPALSSPEQNAPNPGSLGNFENDDHQRASMLLSKIFQNQANSQLEFKKDQVLKPLTGKLESNNEKLQTFLNEVISSGNVPEDLESHLPEGGVLDLNKAFEKFEKQFGTVPEGIPSNSGSNKNLVHVDQLLREFEMEGDK